MAKARVTNRPPTPRRKPPEWFTRPARQRVCIAYPHPSEVGAEFHRSMVNLTVWDAHHDGVFVGGGSHQAVSSGAQITKTRNLIVRQFLDHTDADWLWSIDADMQFEPDTLDRLLKAAHPKDRPIVGGLCFALMRGNAVEVAPTLYGWREDGSPGFKRQLQYEPDNLTQVAATGAACLLIHRSVLVAIRDAKRDDGSPKFPNPWPWFAESVFGEDAISEDLTFCLRAGSLGFPIYVDTGIRIGHSKSIVIAEDSYIAQSMMLQAQAEALAAADPTYVVVPVEKVHAGLPTENDAEHVLVYPNEGDELNLSAKWNRGLRDAESLARAAGHERWNVAILNDDLEMAPDVLDRLAAGLREKDSHAIAYPDQSGQVPPGRYMATQSNQLAGQTMTGWCFMVKGESGLRFDEQFRWWYGDSDIERQVRKNHKLTVAVGGCGVNHFNPTESSKRPDLLALAKDDEARFAAKWGVDPCSLWLALHPEFGQ